MREFGLILVAGLISAALGGGFGWSIGNFAPEFVILLAKPFEVESPRSVATALGAICGLVIGAASMLAGLLIAAMRAWIAIRSERR